METEEQLGRRRSRAAAISVAVAVVLVVVKTVAGVLTGSLSLMASAVDSLTDIFASTVNFFAIRAAARPADREHAYGHGKAEALAGLFQGAVIGGSGAYLAYESVMRILRPTPIESEAVGVAVMAVSVVSSVVLVRFLQRVARETSSLALEADSTHYAIDVITNGAVLVLLAVVRLTGMPVLDPIVSLAISGYILFAAFSVLKESIDHLMDRSLDDDVHERIRVIALDHPTVLGVHDLKTRSAGARAFVELHLEMDGEQSLRDAHDAAVAVLREIEAAIPGSKVFVHTDPVSRPK